MSAASHKRMTGGFRQNYNFERLRVDSDAAMLFAGRYAAQSLQEVLRGTFSLKGIIALAFSLSVIGALLFIDWRALLERKKFKLNFRIWR